MKEIPLDFSDKLGDVYESERGIVISTARGSRAFSTLNRNVNFIGMKHSEGSYVKKNLPNGRYRITYQIIKKDENSPDTVYLSTGGNPEALFTSTNIDLFTEYEYEFEIRERFLAITAMDSYDKNGTTQIELLKLEQLEIFEEDLPQSLVVDSPLTFSDNLHPTKRFTAQFEITETAYYKIDFEILSSLEDWEYKTGFSLYPKGNDLAFEIRKYREGNSYYGSDIKAMGTSGGYYIKPLLPDIYTLVVNINVYQSRFHKFNLTIQFHDKLIIEYIKGKPYKKIAENKYILLKL